LTGSSAIEEDFHEQIRRCESRLPWTRSGGASLDGFSARHAQGYVRRMKVL
jgi:hypothetical protein